MKKIFMTMLLFVASTCVFAQLSVDSVGMVTAGNANDGKITIKDGKIDGHVYCNADASQYQLIYNLNTTHMSTLARILNLTVKTYEPREEQVAPEPGDGGLENGFNSVGDEAEEEALLGVYFIPATSVNTNFQYLVETSPSGYQMVNYAELVPALVQAIKELNYKLENMYGSQSSLPTMQKRVERPDEQGAEASATAIEAPQVSKAVLYQNTPNPFKEQTVIRFSLADDVQDAYICIFDMTGKMLRKLPISSGMDSVTINGYELGEGLYLYSLIVNGQEVDTKKMVISK